MNKVHKLKTPRGTFQQIAFSHKTFELTKFDRDYQNRDHLLLEETDEETNEYTGNSFLIEVSKVSTNKQEIYGLLEDYCILSIKSNSKVGTVYVEHKKNHKKGSVELINYSNLILTDNLYKVKVYWDEKKTARLSLYMI